VASGFGGIAMVGIIVLISLKVLGFLPANLADEESAASTASNPAAAH
jgi:hypothetical protein